MQGRESATDIEFVPIETQRPVPELRIGGSNSFFSATATANARGGSRGNGDGDTQSHAYACTYGHAGAGDNTRRYRALV